MRTLKIAGLILLPLILAFAAYTLISTGFFRTIQPINKAEILQRVSLTGAEDITVVAKDSFALISATDRSGYPATKQEEGGLYYMDLRGSQFEPILLTEAFTQPFAPHGISVAARDSGYIVMAINHLYEEEGNRHTVEVFTLYEQELTHVQTLSDPSMIQPNDLVMIDDTRFYFTNDHRYPTGLGKVIEEYGGLALTNVIYYDGAAYREVAASILYANGINWDPDRNLLYVASPRGFKVKVYRIASDHSLTFVEDIPCGSGVDNIERDTDGSLWVGAHPNLLGFQAYAKGRREMAPSEVLRIDYRAKGDYSVEKVYVEAGETLSASTVAAPFGERLFVGSVLDEEFLVLKR